ncbi:MAG: hypothetical protein M3514_03935 [Actinomycetota bacterium]|nr:hypothetical protein [Actinomycetota bacterium]
MNIRWVEHWSAARLAWSLWVACVALIALALLLDSLLNHDILAYPWQVRSNDRALYPIYAILTGIVSLVYPTIGALIVSRLPRNPIGWIFCGVGLLYQLQHLTIAYSDYALSGKFALPWGENAAGERMAGPSPSSFRNCPGIACARLTIGTTTSTAARTN